MANELQVGDKVLWRPMLHGMIEREYIVVDITPNDDGDDDVMMRTVSKETRTGRMYWEATYKRYMFHFKCGMWVV